MEAIQPRRKPVTYGKVGKKLPFQNLFEQTVEDQSRPVSRPTQDTGGSFQPSAPRKRRPDNSSHLVEPDYNSEELEIQAAEQLRYSLEMTLQNEDSSNSESSNPQYDSPDSSIFEVHSSDEGGSSQIMRRVTTKRRKLTPVRKAHQQQVKDAAYNTPQTIGVTLPNKDMKSKLSQRSRLAVHSWVDAKHLQTVQDKPTSRKPRIASAQAKSTTEHPVREVSRNVLPKTSTETKKTMSTSAKIVAEEHKTPSAVATPRHKKIASAESIASPSHLKLGSLDLTSDEESDRNLTLCFDTSKRSRLVSPLVTPHRSRQRLVDKLDSLHKSAQSSPARCPPARATQAQNLEISVVNTLPSADHSYTEAETTSTVEDLTREVSPAPKDVVYIRQKPTYGQQRSHLSDMVLDELELPAKETSAHSHGLAASQENVHSSFSSHIGPDVRDEDEVPAVAVKSIHELRQAGINSRFERELESLFEDVEAGSTSGKGLRIQALIRLVGRFEDQDFVRQFLDVGMTQRISLCLETSADVLSASLMSLAFARLVMTGHPSSKVLQQMLRTMECTLPNILAERRALSKISKDRKQNLTKSLIRDIAEFEANVANDEIWACSPSTSLNPQAIGLRLLELLVTRLQETKEYRFSVPVELFRSCLGLVENHLQQDPSPRSAGAIKGALSLLEYDVLSESLRTDDDSISVDEYERVCKILAKLLDPSDLTLSDLQTISLRLMITLTNNRPTTCDIFASTTIPWSLSTILHDNFSSLAIAADAGEDLDNAQLETVIMALDSLLDIANRGPEARATLSRQSADGNSVVKTMISIFNDRAGKAAEATTDAQSLVSVPFGHLCMLLCTMCLDTDVRDNVVTVLPGQSLSQLCVEAGNFLDQLQMLVQIQEQGSTSVSATKAMSERFKAILTSLIQSEGAAEEVDN